MEWIKRSIKGPIHTLCSPGKVIANLFCYLNIVKPGFHLQQTPRPRHKKHSDYVVEQSSFPLIALFWLKIGGCRGRNWLYGNQALIEIISQSVFHLP